MIARPLPFEDDIRTRVGTRSGRTAALRRRERSNRQRHVALRRVVAIAGSFTLAIAVYLSLMANVTRLNYELAKSLAQKVQLQEVSARLDDRIARLESRERLSAIASKLGMHEPQTFAEITLPAERVPAPTGIAFLRWLK